MGRVIDNQGLMKALEDRAQGKKPAESPGSDGARVSCPNCGRQMRVPAGKGSVGLGCKGCLHCYRYDYATGAMTALGHIEPPPGHPLARSGKSRRRHLAIAGALAALALLAIALYGFYLAPASPEDAAPRDTLEEIRRQLKSLTD